MNPWLNSVETAEVATATVLQQAELLSEPWTEATT
jgi:hypothetical protein